MSDGVVRDWDATQDLWEYCLKKELSVRLDERPLLITDQLWNTNENRTKAMELAFETLKVPAFYMVKSPVASLYATGKGSGLVVDVGAEVATVTPILDCLALYKRKYWQLIKVPKSAENK
jgi:actin-related protein